MKNAIVLLPLLAAGLILDAQTSRPGREKSFKILISNSHAAKPFGSFLSLFYRDFHPGVDLGYESVIKNGIKSQWFLEGRLGYMFHQWVQHNIALYGDLGYRYAPFPGWSAEMKLGIGYQLSISNSNLFRITESEGLKKKKNYGRSQLIGNLGFGIGKKIHPKSDFRVFLEYKQQIQTPFINEYVPILPYNSMLIGVAIPLKRSQSKSKQ